MEWIWLKMFGSLLLILGLIVGTMWLLKKFMTFNKPAQGAGIAMEIAGVLHLGPRRSVYAVKAGGQVLLLGVAEHAITFLTQLTDAQLTTADAAAGQSTQTLGSAAPFFGVLKEQFARTAGFGREKEPALDHFVHASVPEEPAPSEADAPVKKTKPTTVSRKKAAKPL